MPSRPRRLGVVYLAVAGVIVATVVTCVCYAQLDSILSHYHAMMTLRRSEGTEHHAEWLQHRPALAFPVLLPALAEDDAARCERAAAVMGAVVAAHADPLNPDHAQLTLSVAAKLHQVWARLSPPGRIQATSLAMKVVSIHLSNWSPMVPTALETAGEVVVAGLEDTNTDVCQHALAILRSAWAWQGTDRVTQELIRAWQRRCYMQAVSLMEHSSETLRAAATSAVTGAPFHEGDVKLISAIEDKSSAVRKAALVALAGADASADSLRSEQKIQLMSFLNDPDADVRDAASRLLRASGVSEPVLRLAKLVKHPSPDERVKVVEQAFLVQEIDPARWVLELAGDPSPRVRVAVARVASTSDHPALRKALASMADADPDPLVRDMCKQFVAAQVAKRPAGADGR